MATPMAVPHTRETTVALGVFSHPSYYRRRVVIADTWMARFGRAWTVRFVLGGVELLANRTHVVLPVNDTWSGNGVKFRAWLEFALVYHTDFIANADDDAFVSPKIQADLLGFQRARLVAYGAVEWCAYDEQRAQMYAWGGGAWESLSGWRSADGFGDSPPFPFVKGPFMAFSSDLVRALIPPLREIEARTVLGGPRILMDVVAGYALSMYLRSLSITLLDIGRTTKAEESSRGFAEMRRGRDLRKGCLRVLHFGSNTRKNSRSRKEAEFLDFRTMMTARNLADARCNRPLRFRCHPFDDYVKLSPKKLNQTIGGRAWRYCRGSLER